MSHPAPQPDRLDNPALDPAFAVLPMEEKREAWWRGTDDAAAVQAGEDVAYAHDHFFPSGLYKSCLKDEQWASVAYYLAAGASVMEVARHFGVSRSTIWRGMQRSADLRRRVTAERNMMRRESDSRFVALRHAVVDGLQRAILAGNVRVLLWAADRLDLGTTLLPTQEKEPNPGPEQPRRRRKALSSRAPAGARPVLDPPDACPPPIPAPLTTRPEPAPADPSPALDAAAPDPATVAAVPAGRAAPAAPPVKRLTCPPLLLRLRQRPAGPDGVVASGLRIPRRARPALRHLARQVKPPLRLAADVDTFAAETMALRGGPNLPWLPANAAEPLNPYRPLRHYRWDR